MLRKARGCAVVVAVLAAALGLLAYRFLWVPAQERWHTFGERPEVVELVAAIEAARGGLAWLDGAPSGDGEPLPAEAPPGGSGRGDSGPPARSLDAEGLDDLLAVQRAVRRGTEERLDQVEERLRSLRAELTSERVRWSRVGELAQETGELLGAARRERDRALAERGLAPADYRRLQLQAYRALGADLTAAGIGDLPQLAAALLEEGASAGLEQRLEPDATVQALAPDEHRRLVRPHQEELRRWLPLALVGL